MWNVKIFTTAIITTYLSYLYIFPVYEMMLITVLGLRKNTHVGLFVCFVFFSCSWSVHIYVCFWFPTLDPAGRNYHAGMC